MSDELLYMRHARRQVDAFQGQSQWLQEHREAMECLDCEAFLQMGIEAFDWLRRTDLVIRRAVYAGKVEYDPAVEEALEAMLKSWLATAEQANAWISLHSSRGYDLSNLDHFRKCREEVQSIVRAFSSESCMTEALEVLQDEAIREHRDGKTAEFI